MSKLRQPAFRVSDCEARTVLHDVSALSLARTGGDAA